MYCPFRKTTININAYDRPINVFDKLIVSVKEEFNECLKYECAAWDGQCCLLCRRTLKGIEGFANKEDE